MFSQKKKNHTWIYAVIALTIAVIAVFILIGALSNQNKNEKDKAQRTNIEQSVEGDTEQEDIGKPDAQVNSTEKTDENQFYQSYYLVKLDNHVVKIYFSDETGNLTELEQTKIVYETLSTDDQQKFRDGMKIQSRDDLNKLIMDYES